MSKHSGKFISYLRVSTERQGASGLGLEAQRASVHAWLNGGKWQLLGEFIEQESGKKIDRPQLTKALAACRSYGATLLVARLDRLSRNAEFLLKLVRESGERGVCFADMPNIPEGPAGKLLIGVMAQVAQFEGEMISQRTSAALQAKKARGERLGTIETQRIAQYAAKGHAAALKLRQEKARQRAADLAPVIAELRSQGITSQRGLAKALNDAGIPSARGQWSAPAVTRLLANMDVA